MSGLAVSSCTVAPTACSRAVTYRCVFIAFESRIPQQHLEAWEPVNQKRQDGLVTIPSVPGNTIRTAHARTRLHPLRSLEKIYGSYSTVAAILLVAKKSWHAIWQALNVHC